MNIDRRTFAKTALAAASGLSLPSLAVAAKMEDGSATPRLKVVCVGGHPDDPESGCGGTLAKLANAGHKVTAIYLTRGERGIAGATLAEAAAMRTKEAQAVAEILGVRCVFAGQEDGATVADNDQREILRGLIKEEAPDIVFTHWPIDSHLDHQVASVLTTQVWVHMGKPFEVYFFEVCTGSQTMGFRPTDYVDITATREQKRKAVYCHVSQDPPGVYVSSDCNHQQMEKFRGLESQCEAAEAFVKLNGALRVF